MLCSSNTSSQLCLSSASASLRHGGWQEPDKQELHTRFHTPKWCRNWWFIPYHAKQKRSRTSEFPSKITCEQSDSNSLRTKKPPSSTRNFSCHLLGNWTQGKWLPNTDAELFQAIFFPTYLQPFIMYFPLTASPPCRHLNYHITQNSNSGSTSQHGSIYFWLSFQMYFGNQRNKEVLKLLKVIQKPCQVLNFELKLTVKKYLICLNILWMFLGEPFSLFSHKNALKIWFISHSTSHCNLYDFRDI